MSDWLNPLIQGVLLGGFYSLVACGLSFMFQVMGIINLAHGALAVLAGFAFLVFATYVNVSPFIALIGVIPGMALVGWVLQRGVLDRSARAGILVPILATFGLAVLIDNLLFQQFGANPRSLAPHIGTLSYSSWALGGNLYIGKLPALVFAVAVALLSSLSLFLSKTRLGRSIRATGADPDTVGLIGINASKVNAIATAIAMVTVGIAGMFLAMRSSITPYTGSTVLIFAFEAAVIGGSGSLWGTLLGGIILGVAQTFGGKLSSEGFLLTGHIVFLVIVVARVSIARPSLGQIKAMLRLRAR